MEKNKKKKVITVLKRVFLSLTVIILICAIPLIKPFGEDMSVFYKTFVGKKSSYQGMIEIWNIDTFESGNISKTKLLTNIANNYQKKNKGVYFMIRNVTEQECLNLLESGECPDLFSCSYGVAEKIKNYVKPYSSSDFDIRQEFIDAGSFNGELYGLAWSRGCYFLISTKEKLQKAGAIIDGEEKEFSLLENALSLGYEIKNKNSTKIVYSLVFGNGKYLMPQVALNSYNNVGLGENNNFALNSNNINQTQYTAYSKFVAGEAVVLLGSNRDVFRMENRVKNGKVSDVIYYPLSKFTDLVQFMFIGKNASEEKFETINDFASFITGESTQKLLANFGMLPVNMADENNYNNGIMKDIIPEINGDLTLYNVFLSESEITELRHKNLLE